MGKTFRPKTAKAVSVAKMPTEWDKGAMGPANRVGLVQEAATDFDVNTGKDAPNPNGVRRHRRVIWIDHYEQKGKLTRAQCAMGHILYAAYHGSPNRDPLAAMGDRVDGGGAGDAQVSAIDRKRELYRMKARIPQGAWPFVEHVVIMDRPIRAMAGCADGHAESRYMARLCNGLDAIG